MFMTASGINTTLIADVLSSRLFGSEHREVVTKLHNKNWMKAVFPKTFEANIAVCFWGEFQTAIWTNHYSWYGILRVSRHMQRKKGP